MKNKDYLREIAIQKIGCTATIATVSMVINTLKTGEAREAAIDTCEKLLGVLQQNMEHFKLLETLLSAEQMMEDLKNTESTAPPFVPKDAVAIDINELLRQLGMEDGK